MALVQTFRAALRAGAALELPDQELDPLLEEKISRAAARWPSLPLEPAEMAAAMGARVRSVSELQRLHVEELHLAVACARGVRGATEAFETQFLSSRPLAVALGRIDPSPAFLDEVRQAARERLFVPPPGRIAGYSGRGSLAAWTRVVTLRIALDLRPQHPVAPEEEAERAVQRDPELRYLQQAYGRQFEQALESAFALLDDEQANLMALQIVDGLGTAQIAALFRVDRSTIKRRLAACRQTLLDHTHTALREKLGLSPQSFESLARLLTSQLHLSVARILKERG